MTEEDRMEGLRLLKEMDGAYAKQFGDDPDAATAYDRAATAFNRFVLTHGRALLETKP